MLLQAISPLFVTLNLLEAALWAALAVGVAVATARGRVRAWRGWVAAATLLLFGVSDVVETRTGAWYSPPWLLAWKGACVVVLAWLAWLAVRDGRRSRAGA